MAFCKNCGKEIDDNAVVCPHCGVQQAQVQQAVVDEGGFLWGCLGFCIPLVGLLLFLVWHDTKPKTAKAAGMGALISVIIAVLFYAVALIGGVGSAMMSY